MIAEVVVENSIEVREAQNMGADSLLLVRNLKEGGISPDLKTIGMCMDAARVPLSILVRPDNENYSYEEGRRRRTLKILELYWNHGIRNITFGAIHNTVMDWDLLEDAITHGFSVNINLAFDHTLDLTKNYLQLAMYPMVRQVTTRGKAETALSGQDEIRTLVHLDRPNLPLLAESTGLTPENLKPFLEHSGVHGVQFGLTARERSGKFNFLHLESCIGIMRKHARSQQAGNSVTPTRFRF
ncbi:copper homeostasis protein CutC [Deinococcus cellulosilyticus]|uniref:Copper homeostasis protein cutC homolog n=1 Tax=Deinococcus cellulosilyticus (strain DSM 18568 / NBRC 106333 / KACC 11606 / 5516J-15) TaxID=1223518 RepID=A0A511NAA2_DEIC1|nr:copper homeostasis protein CutC [Deinococcus cellulosilyticus]GEM49762.1 hypothetical protein DC3_53970 [Deinococcus cellulosilyticus NBRC 106333 = KACC 11606]